MRDRKIEAAIAASKDAGRRLRSLVEAARLTPPRAALGPFPYSHRSVAEVADDPRLDA